MILGVRKTSHSHQTYCHN